MSVISYYTDKDGNHIESGTGRVLSTPESRAKEDIPQWKKFEVGRLEEVDGHIVPGPNALEKDIKQYGANVEKTGRATMRKRDWDVITGWEKRIKVDFGSIGPNHVRWSDWTHKERDIVARKVHESTLVSQNHGPRSKRMEEWAKENAPVMIGFARDQKPMPDWAHAEYRPSGIPEYVKVVWARKDPDNPASLGDWAYDPPCPSDGWKDEGDEPAWSARPKDPDYDPNNDVAPAEEVADDPGPTEKPKSGATDKPNDAGSQEVVRTVSYKLMPDDDKFTPLEKALNWASETHHGPDHQYRWNRVAAALGAENDHSPMTYSELKRWWNKFGQNARWSMAMEALGGQDDVENRAKEMERYHSKLSMQGNYTSEDWKRSFGTVPVICKFEGYEELTIFDRAAGVPNWWLDGPGEAVELWRLEDNGGLTYLGPIASDAPAVDGPVDAQQESPETGDPEVLLNAGTVDDAETNRLDFAIVASLPEMTEDEAEQFYKDNKGDSICWTHQREPSIGPVNVVVMFHNGVPIARRKSKLSEFSYLPSWTRNQVADYFLRVLKRKKYSRRTLDGHWATVRGYEHPDTHKPVALAATQAQEDHEVLLNEAIRANDWSRVVTLANEAPVVEKG